MYFKSILSTSPWLALLAVGLCSWPATSCLPLRTLPMFPCQLLASAPGSWSRVISCSRCGGWADLRPHWPDWGGPACPGISKAPMELPPAPVALPRGWGQHIHTPSRPSISPTLGTHRQVTCSQYTVKLKTRLTISVLPFLSHCTPRCQAQLGLHIFLQPPLTSTITSQSASSPKAGLGFWEVSKAPPSPHLYLIPVSGNADHTNWQCKRRLPATDCLHSDHSH